jgi:long-chain acyl-CoA synthetase
MLLASSLRRAVQVRGDELALVCEERRWTWSALHDRVARLASALSGLGVAAGDRVALLLANGDDAFVLLHAIAWMGAVSVPLNTRWTADEIALAIEDCGPALLVTDEVFRSLGEMAVSRAPTPLLYTRIDGPRLGSMQRLIENHPPAAAAECSSNDLMAIFYTGGTTGRSKGVMLSHGNIAFNALSNLAEGLYSPDQIYLHTSPAFHIAGASAIFSVVVSAATSVVLPRFDAGEVLKTIQREKCTETLLVPTMIQMVLEHADLPHTNLSSLRRINYGAAPISEAVLNQAAAVLPGVAFTQLYGMTELSPVCAILHAQEHGPTGRAKNRHRAAGRAAFGVELAIAGPDGDRLPARRVGEIVARGPNVMLGYWKRPEETAEALRGGWMHTGDGGFMDEDGFVYVVDRVKDMIITGGENVYSVEVENALGQHPSVRQCAVIGVPHAHWGEQVHGVVVIREGYAADPAALEAWCRERLAAFKIPRSFEFRQEPLPLSGAGKVLKRDLRQPYWEGRGRHVG